MMEDRGRFEDDFARIAAWIAAYERYPERYPVLARNSPGAIVEALPREAPEHGEPFEEILRDFERVIVPGITHWNHPRFFAYFATSSEPVAVLAEALAAALDVKAMLWRTSPAATELEQVVTRWVARLMGLPDAFEGIIYDTASIAGFTALAAARHAVAPALRDSGMIASGMRPMRIYVTDQTHAHIEKAAIALGIGRDNVVRVPCDERYRMRPDALAAQIASDHAAGLQPVAVVATAGTTSTTSVDPLAEIAAVARRERVWVHVDAAYAGAAAMLPEMRATFVGMDEADSIVVNPHKWLFVPMDCSILYVRDEAHLRRTFSVVPDYLATDEGGVRNYMDYGLQLGRRFRALKLWFVLRALGAETIRARLRNHIAWAQEFASWVAAEPNWEVCAPHPFSVVCFRSRPPGLDEAGVEAHNARVLEAVNASGEAFLSHTRLNGRYVLRLAIGNRRTGRDDVARAWALLKESACAFS